MKQTAGYLIALFLGLFIGWLAQQFWFIGRDAEYTLPSERDLARYQNRLEQLKREPVAEEKISPITSLSKVDSSFDKQIVNEDFEGSIVEYQNAGVASLKKALSIAELGMSRQQYETLLLFLYDVRLQLDAKDEQLLLKEIAILVEQMDKQLTAQQDVQRLVDIYRLLISLEAENPYYYLRLSYWLLQAGELVQAKEALTGAKNDIRYAKDLKELTGLIERTENGRLNYYVPLTQAGDHYLVAVTLNDSLETQLMLDTGASKTVVKSELADRFLTGYQRDGSTIRLSTANGDAEGLALNLSHLRMGDADLSDIEIVLMELSGFGHDGLLGMNVLSRFEFSIDQMNSQLILRPRLGSGLKP